MKITLSLSEVGKIIMEHLCKTGKLKYDIEAVATWRVANKLDDSYIEIEQQDV